MHASLNLDELNIAIDIIHLPFPLATSCLENNLYFQVVIHVDSELRLICETCSWTSHWSIYQPVTKPRLSLATKVVVTIYLSVCAIWIWITITFMSLLPCHGIITSISAAVLTSRSLSISKLGRRNRPKREPHEWDCMGNGSGSIRYHNQIYD